MSDSETDSPSIKALIVFRENGETDNLFVPILCDAIRMAGINVRYSQKEFWESDTTYDIIHFQWPRADEIILMKKKLIYLGLTGCILFALCTRLQAQIDSLQTHRYVTRATMYGVGFTNVFDTYLSPQEYKGIDFRISRETIRMTKLFDGNVSVQNFFQADIGYTHNRADNNNTFSGFTISSQDIKLCYRCDVIICLWRKCFQTEITSFHRWIRITRL